MFYAVLITLSISALFQIWSLLHGFNPGMLVAFAFTTSAIILSLKRLRLAIFLIQAYLIFGLAALIVQFLASNPYGAGISTATLVLGILTIVYALLIFGVWKTVKTIKS